MIENDFITIIDGIENLDSNLMGMLHGGLSINMNDCNCGSGNSNTEQTEHGSNDCTCGSGNSNKIAAPSDCTCGSANSNSTHSTIRQLQFG